MAQKPEYKITVRFYKGGMARFISHLDFIRFIYRALRRAELPFYATEGFSPRPKVAFGQALKVGAEGAVDVCFSLREDLSFAQLCGRLAVRVGDDIKILDVDYGQ